MNRDQLTRIAPGFVAATLQRCAAKRGETAGELFRAIRAGRDGAIEDLDAAADAERTKRNAQP